MGDFAKPLYSRAHFEHRLESEPSKLPNEASFLLNTC